VTDAAVLSPLGLLLRDAHQGDRQAAEVLVLTFNQDLAFLEKAALGWMEQLGARVTVIGDAAMADHDPYAVHRAGVAYLPGRAVCSGAFHPKLFVVAGEDLATVAVGSGNLTLAGWHGNDECWSVHHADTETGSAVVAATAGFLDRLVEVVRLSEGCERALRAVSALLRDRPATDTRARLVSSLDQAILTQLPEGPVDELCLYAPFHDPAGAAVKTLIDRFDPAVVRLAVQPGLTHIDGAVTAPLLAGRGDLVVLDSSPYRHGKLVEWRIGPQRWALTGSPNLSAAALLNRVGAGGNVELGVVASVDSSLFPEGEPAGFDALHTLEFPSPTAPTSAQRVLLLSATRTGEGLRVLFAAPLPEPVEVQVSVLGDLPDRWSTVGTVEAGAVEATIADVAPGGSRLRVKFADGAVSSFVPVSDPERLLRARRAGGGGPKVPPIGEILGGDPHAVEVFWAVMDELRSQEALPLPKRTPPPRPGGGGPGSFEVGDWEDYLDRCQARAGAGVVAFAFGLPFLHRPAGGVIDIDWDDEQEPVDDHGSMDEDDPEEAAEDTGDQVSMQAALRRATEATRKRWRQDAEKMVAAVADRDPHERLLSARLVLLLEACELWPSGDDSWAALLLRAVDSLVVDDAPEEYEVLAGSLAAVALAVTRTALPRHHTNPLKTHHQKTTERVAHLLVAADEERVENYLVGITQRFGVSAEVEEIMSLCSLVVAGDEVALALDRLLDKNIVASAEGPVITLDHPVPAPFVACYEVLAEAVKASPLAISCAGTKTGIDRWALVVWDAPDLHVVQPGKADRTRMSRRYHYRPGTSPTVDISTTGRPDPDRLDQQTMAGQALPGDLATLLTQLGVHLGI